MLVLAGTLLGSACVPGNFTGLFLTTFNTTYPQLGGVITLRLLGREPLPFPASADNGTTWLVTVAPLAAANISSSSSSTHPVQQVNITLMPWDNTTAGLEWRFSWMMAHSGTYSFSVSHPDNASVLVGNSPLQLNVYPADYDAVACSMFVPEEPWGSGVGGAINIIMLLRDASGAPRTSANNATLHIHGESMQWLGHRVWSQVSKCTHTHTVHACTVLCTMRPPSPHGAHRACERLEKCDIC